MTPIAPCSCPQNASKVVFCGTFDAKGTALDIGEGKLSITRHGEVTKLVGAVEPISLTESVDASLRNPQVPVHPKVARDLGVKWADERTRYLNRGRQVTWEGYIRSYIEHYG